MNLPFVPCCLPHITDTDRETLSDLALLMGKVIELETRDRVIHRGVVTSVGQRAFYIVTDNGGVCLVPSELVWFDEVSK